MLQKELSLIALLVLLCQHGVKAVNLITCEGGTTDLTCAASTITLWMQLLTCESETAQFRCGQGTIKVLSANYGRTNSVSCSTGRPAGQLSNVQCTQSTSLSVIANQCDGKKDCSVSVSNTVFGDPCYGTYKYLNVSYTCVQSATILTTCEGATIDLTCNNLFIKVLSANYGRTNSATCSTGRPAGQLSNIQCIQSTSLSVMANQCNEKKDCSVAVSNTVFGDPCYGTYKYLKVFYTCVPKSKRSIKVLSANYGRTNTVTCSTGRPAGQLSNVQCTQSTSLSVMANQCDGKQDCSVPVSNTVFGDPCYGTYKYLNVSYTCVQS